MLHIFQGFAKNEEDSKELQFNKVLALIITLACCLCGVLWSLVYFRVFGVVFTSFLPLVFVVVVGTSAVAAHILKNYHIMVYAQIICIMGVTAMIQWSIGSIDQSGLVFAWAFLGPSAALIFLDRSKVFVAVIIWLVLLGISMFMEPNLFGNSYDLPREVKSVFYLMNLGASYSVFILALFLFYREKERSLALFKKNRTLERTNYEQELMLRQSEKLATLGRLSAGIAHELNNPSAAVQSGAFRLQNSIPQLNITQYQLGATAFTDEELGIASSFIDQHIKKPPSDQSLDSLEKSELEDDMECLLKRFGIVNAWEIAPGLVSMEVGHEELEGIHKKLGDEKVEVVVMALHNLHVTNDLLDEIIQGSSRISEIVKALKAYTYMDQSPKQFIQLNEGLNNTLVMLRSKLKHGITVHKDFKEDLPEVFAYGSELNQVWTNLIDNAVDAMEGKGNIFLKTWNDNEKVFVEVKDTGGGIPEEVKRHIFDPFFTTKEQGKGTGLGLHISHNIIVNKHRGAIFVDSKPSGTTFRIELPLDPEKPIIYELYSNQKN